MTNTSERIELTKDEKSAGLVAMWDIITTFGHYVISFGQRGFSGYQIEAKDTPGEATLPEWRTFEIVRRFRLSA